MRWMTVVCTTLILSAQAAGQSKNTPPPPGFVVDKRPADIVLDKPAPASTSQTNNWPTPTQQQHDAAAELSDVLAAAQVCRQDGGGFMKCFVDASPKRCKQAAIAFVSNPGYGRRAWAMCVQSCGEEGYFTRTFGECSK